MLRRQLPKATIGTLVIPGRASQGVHVDNWKSNNDVIMCVWGASTREAYASPGVVLDVLSRAKVVSSSELVILGTIAKWSPVLDFIETIILLVYSTTSNSLFSVICNISFGLWMKYTPNHTTPGGALTGHTTRRLLWL
jgi:hypothetical protein